MTMQTDKQKAARKVFLEKVQMAKRLRAHNPALSQAEAIKLAYSGAMGANQMLLFEAPAKKTAKKKAAPNVAKKATKKAAPKAAKTNRKRKNEYSQRGSSSLLYDKRHQALPPGYRISKKTGREYLETRANRSDRGQLLGFGNVYEFFTVSDITDADSLKKAYFKLAKVYHPDAGGTKEQFQRLQSEYELLQRKILTGSNLTAEEIKTEIELDAAMRNIIDALVTIPNITIELIGKWLWVSGATYPVRNELKAAGLSFAPLKKVWYYAGTESGGRGTKTLTELRDKYGSKMINPKRPPSLDGIGLVLSLAKRKKLLLNLRKAVKALNKRTAKPIKPNKNIF